LELRIVQMLLRSSTNLFVLEISKGTIALGYQKQRLESGRLFTDMLNEANKIGLRWKIPDPYCVACNITL
jgi:hypothetical protein